MTPPNTGFLPLSIEGGDGIVVSQTGAHLKISAPALGSATFIEPGPDFDTRIADRIAAGDRIFQLGDGDYEASSSIFAGVSPDDTSGIILTGLGWRRTRLLGTMSGSSATADVPSNALLTLPKTLTGEVATTLSLTAISWQDAIVLTSTVGVTAGMWLRVQGGAHIAGFSDAYGMSDSAAVGPRRTEYVQVASGYAGGNPVPLTRPLRQWHGFGATVESVLVTRNVLIEGMTFDCSGLAVASGIFSDGSVGLTVQDCAFVGFSRAGIGLELGTRDFDLSTLLSLGENNSLVFCESAMSGQIRRVASVSDGLRAHATGEPRALLTFWTRCTDIKCSDLFLQHAHCAVRRWGGWHLQWNNVQVADMDGDAIYARSPCYMPAGKLGLAYDGGAGPLGVVPNAFGGISCYGEEFAYSCTLADWEISDTYVDQSHQDLCYAIYDHDVLHSSWGHVSMANGGPGAGTVLSGRTVWTNGCHFADSSVVIDKLQITGQQAMAMSVQATGNATIAEYNVDGVSGNSSGTLGLHIFGPAFVPRIDIMRIKGGASPPTYDAVFHAAPDFSMRIGRLEWEGAGNWSNVILAVNQTGAPLGPFGTVLEFAAGGTRDVGLAAAATEKACVLVFGNVPNGSACLVSPCPSEEVWANVTGVGATGDKLEADGAGNFVVNGATVRPAGRLAQTKAGAGVAVVQVSAAY